MGKKKEVIGECHREPFIKSRHKMLLKTFAIEMSFIHRVLVMHTCMCTCVRCGCVRASAHATGWSLESFDWWAWPKMKAFFFFFSLCYLPRAGQEFIVLSVVTASRVVRKTQKQLANILELSKEIQNHIYIHIYVCMYVQYVCICTSAAALKTRIVPKFLHQRKKNIERKSFFQRGCGEFRQEVSHAGAFLAPAVTGNYVKGWRP